jgi:serine protease Do
LPDEAPSDPLFPVETETLKPGMIAEGTSFPIAPNTWLTARHVANGDCQHLVMVVDGHQVAARISRLDANADLAVLTTPGASGPALALETDTPDQGETAYSFGFPNNALGATRDQLMGRGRIQLSGHLGGVGPVLTWAELQRFPDSLPALSGMSGGPMMDQNGKVVGIMVAASVRRGRVHSVAPEVLRATATALALSDGATQAAPADVSGATAAPGDTKGLGETADQLSHQDRIAKTYCIPHA